MTMSEVVTGWKGNPLHAMQKQQQHRGYLKLIGVLTCRRFTSPFDPGYDPVTLESHLEQSSHLIAILKISMACWMIARRRCHAPQSGRGRSQYSVPTVTGGGPFEIAVAQGRLPEYLDLCAVMGFTRIECGEGFTEMPLGARGVVAMADSAGSTFSSSSARSTAAPSTRHRGSTDRARTALDGCRRPGIGRGSPRERAGVGLFDENGNLNRVLADRFARAFGLDTRDL